MSSKGIVLLGEDKTIQAKAKSMKLPVTIDAGMPLAYDKTLFVEPGTRVPYDLLPAAWHFLERWDAAVPLWRHGVNATDMGTPSERKRTEKVMRDLRVLPHAVELLFVRNNGDGRALVEAYREELEGGGEKRLAFLRAYYRVKPRLCVLPRSWLAEVFSRSKQDARSRRGRRAKGAPLVLVDLGNGRYVKCNPGDEEKVREMMANRRGRRG